MKYQLKVKLLETKHKKSQGKIAFRLLLTITFFSYNRRSEIQINININKLNININDESQLESPPISISSLLSTLIPGKTMTKAKTRKFYCGKTQLSQAERRNGWCATRMDLHSKLVIVMVIATYHPPTIHPSLIVP